MVKQILFLFCFAACHRKTKVLKNSDAEGCFNLPNEGLEDLSSLVYDKKIEYSSLSIHNHKRKLQQNNLNVIENMNSSLNQEQNSVNSFPNKKVLQTESKPNSCTTFSGDSTNMNPIVVSKYNFDHKNRNLNLETVNLGSKSENNSKIPSPEEVIQEIILIQKQAAFNINKWNESRGSSKFNMQIAPNPEPKSLNIDEDDIKSQNPNQLDGSDSPTRKFALNKLKVMIDSKKTVNTDSTSKSLLSSCLKDINHSSSKLDFSLGIQEPPSRVNTSIYLNRINRVKFKFKTVLTEIEEKYLETIKNKDLEHEFLKNLMSKIAAIYIGLYHNFFYFSKRLIRIDRLYYKMLYFVDGNLGEYSFSNIKGFLIICRRYRIILNKCLNLFHTLDNNDECKKIQKIQLFGDINEFYNELEIKYRKNNSLK